MLMNILVEMGRVFRDLEVAELTIRGIRDEDDWTADFDDEYGPVVPRTQLRLQGHIVNTTARPLSNVCYDVSYYDKDGRFLGLDRSSLLEDDDLDPEDSLPIDMPLTMPEETHQCVFNVRARRRRWPTRWF
jgi:hypothetical protein